MEVNGDRDGNGKDNLPCFRLNKKLYACSYEVNMSLCITGYKELSPVTMPLCEPQRGMFLSVMPLSENGRRIYAVTFFGWKNLSEWSIFEYGFYLAKSIGISFFLMYFCDKI